MPAYDRFLYVNPRSTYSGQPSMYICRTEEYYPIPLASPQDNYGLPIPFTADTHATPAKFSSFPSAFKIIRNNYDVEKILVGKNPNPLYVASWYCLFEDLTPAYIKVYTNTNPNPGGYRSCNSPRIIATPKIIYMDHPWFVNMIRKCFYVGFWRDPSSVIWDEELLNRFFVKPSTPSNVETIDDDIYELLKQDDACIKDMYK